MSMTVNGSSIRVPNGTMEQKLKRKTKAIRDLRIKVCELNFLACFLSSVVIILAGLCAYFALNFMKVSNEAKALYQENKALSQENKELEDKYEVMYENFDELTTISKTLDSQNKELVKSNQEYYEENSMLKERKELYDKYEYAIVYGGERTDITYDQLKTVESLCEDKNMDDPDMILATAMVESSGKSNARSSESTAKGYGQLLDGTSKFVYTKLLGQKGWSPAVSLDPEKNLEMMVAFYDYLYSKHGSLPRAVTHYRGLNDTGYVNKINSFLASKDKSINSIDARLRD